jgi:3-dehydroquinate dehydratase/shikimate dehydrogenase
MNSRLTVCLPVTTITDALTNISSLDSAIAVVELRFDYLQKFDFAAIKELFAKCNIPFIVTVRKVADGGKFAGSETDRLELLQQLIILHPPYIDIEAEVADAEITKLAMLAPKTKIIRSTHNFINTPQDLLAILNSLQHSKVSIYKIVTMANTSLDALRMMAFVTKHTEECNLVGHCMGAEGMISRIASPVIGNYFLYAALDNADMVLPNQVSVSDLIYTYNILQKNLNTKLFALIGDPVDKSVGHIFHNKYFAQHNINALYVKIKITAQELAEFISYCHVLPFAGLSVTMPLKKEILPFVVNESTIAAVNTLKISHDRITATNTDGVGAVAAIEAKINVINKRVLVIGAGGAAVAIVAELVRRNAIVTIANRTLATAALVAEKYNIQVVGIASNIQHNYDIIINTLPNKVYLDKAISSWLELLLVAKPLVMDVNYNQEQNNLLLIANRFACPVVIGEDMFVNQARLQLKYWFTAQGIV